jgi:hypothetical protein
VTDLTCTGYAVGAFSSAETKRDGGECRLGYEVYPFETTLASFIFRRRRVEIQAHRRAVLMFAGDFPKPLPPLLNRTHRTDLVHAFKLYRVVEVQLHTFFTALLANEWSS